MTLKKIISRIPWMLLAGGLCLGSSYYACAEEPLNNKDALARAVLQKADEIRFPTEAFQVDIDVTSYAPDQSPEKRKYRVLSKGNDKTLVMILEPASERGQIILMKGHDLWVFMPDVSQPIRLGLSQRLTGQVANGDMARANFTGDYDPSIARTEPLSGREYDVLELKALSRDVTYHRVLLWVDKINHRPLKAEFYSLSNRLLKICKYENYQTAVGRLRPMRQIMEDALTSGSTSIMEYHDFKLRNLPDEVFSKEYLKKLQ